ncbi:hypothetical protein [Desulfonatronum parangueonense]
MIRLIWSVLCREILTDRETNSVSYIHSIEEGAATVLPTRIAPISLGTLWEMDTPGPEPFAARVILKNPAGQEVGLLQTGQLSFTNPRHRLHFRLQGLPMTAFGRHEIRLEFSQGSLQDNKWQCAAIMPFVLRRLVMPEKTSK